MAKAQGTETKAAVGECRQLLAEQLGQALHLLAQGAKALIIDVDHQAGAVALLFQARGKTAGQHMLKAHEHLKGFTQRGTGLLSVTEHIHRSRLHHFAQVQANIAIARQVRQRLPEHRRHLVHQSRLGRARLQRHALIGLAVNLQRVEAEGLQALIQQAAQGGGMGQWEEIGNWHGRPANK